LLGVKKVGAVCRRGCAARIARRHLRGAIYAARSCAARNDAARLNLNLGLKLKSGARRGGGEQALVIPGIAISVDFHLCVIHGARVFAASTVVVMNFAFLLVFVLMNCALSRACLPRCSLASGFYRCVLVLA
jgi:hypothetical protein